MARLEIRLLGGFDVRLHGEPVEGFESDTARALLARLAAEPGRPIRRADLAEQLWPDRPEGAALANLRHTLAQLRHTIGDADAPHPFLRVTATDITVDPTADVRVDVVELERLARVDPAEHGAVAAWEQATALVRGELLDRFDVHAGAGWDEWLLRARDATTRTAVELLDRLAALRERTGEHARAVSLVRRQLDLDPWDERAHRRLMRLLAIDGNRASALVHADDLAARLRVALDVGLDPQTLALVAEIREGRFPDAAGAAAAPARVDLREHPPVRFVDRAGELAWLDGRLDDALAGAGRVVLVGGEAGSGKSLLLEAFAERAAAGMPNLVVVRGRCNAFNGAGDPYLPFRQVLATLCRDPHVVGALLDEGPYLLGTLVDPLALQRHLDDVYPDDPVTARLQTVWLDLAHRAADPMRQQQPLLDQCARVLLRVAERHPLLLLIDDLHWADDGTVELLFHLAHVLGGASVLLAAAFRPEDVALSGGDVRRGVAALLPELRRLFGEARLELGESREFVDALLDDEPNQLGVAFRDRLFELTRGHPLLTVEVVQAMRQRGELRVDDHGRWSVAAAINWDHVPPRAEAVIEARLGALPPEQRADLAAASVQGEVFQPTIVAAARDVGVGEVVQRLAVLAAMPAPIVTATGDDPAGPYRFRHGLFQRVLAGGLAAPERRRLHAATGWALLAAAPTDESLAIELARHFDGAGLVDDAIDQHVRAGRRAMALSANVDAITSLRRALELIDRNGVDDTDRTPDDRRRLLAVLTALGSCLQARDGYTAPETDRVYERVRHLVAAEGPTIEAVQALGAVVTVDCLRARYATARAGYQQLLAVAHQLGMPLIEAVAHMQAGLVELMTGHPAGADEHLRTAAEQYDPATDGWLTYVVGQDVGSTTLSWWAVTAWQLGRTDEARELGDRAIALAREVGHPFSLAFALAIGGCLVSYLRGEPDAALGAADEVARIAEREDFAFYRSAALVHHGLAHGLKGRLRHGLDELEAGMAGWRALGTDAFACWLGTARAELLVADGRLDEADAALAEVQHLLAVTGEHLATAPWWLARARLSTARGATADAAAALQTARDVATSRSQHAVARQAEEALAALRSASD